MSLLANARRLFSTGDAKAVSGDSDSGFPLTGFAPSSVAVPLVDGLSDQDLVELNGLLRWHCFTVDAKGRRFGRRSKPGKREEPQAVPDLRIVDMDKRFGLKGKTVLEIGCFEGVHTIALAMQGAQVTAIDSRMENVVKTIVRTSFFGFQPKVFKCDVEDPVEQALLPEVDFLHHVGVLYHLVDPVSHLRQLASRVRGGLMLDTHYAEPEKAVFSYEVAGRSYPYMRFGEGGRSEVFSGMYDHAKWLTLDSLVALLRELGFASVEVVEKRAERNGPRLRLFAARAAAT